MSSSTRPLCHGSKDVCGSAGPCGLWSQALQARTGPPSTGERKGKPLTRDNRPEAAASGPGEQGTEPYDRARVHHVATRFVQAYSLTRVDPEFDQLFAETVEIWHSFDHKTMSLPGGEFAGAMLRMLRATAEIVRGHSDRIWSLKVDHDGFALAATASGELEDRTPVHISRCLLVTVHEGRITRICEFGDHQQRTPLDEGLRAAGRFRS